MNDRSPVNKIAVDTKKAYNKAMHYPPPIELVVVFIASVLIWIKILWSVITFVKSDKKTKKNLLGNGLFILFCSYAIAFIASLIYENPRPFIIGGFDPLASNSMDNGFPSDHTLFALIIAFTFLKTHKRLAYTFFVFTLLIGLGRVLAGVHHIIDIIGSLVIVSLVYWTLSKTKSLRS